jgi:hypothetical protein
MEASMKVGQIVKLHKDIHESTDLGIVSISKDESGTILSLKDNKVEVVFDGPYTLNSSNEASEVILDKIKLSIDAIKSHNYFRSQSDKF